MLEIKLITRSNTADHPPTLSSTHAVRSPNHDLTVSTASPMVSVMTCQTACITSERFDQPPPKTSISSPNWEIRPMTAPIATATIPNGFASKATFNASVGATAAATATAKPATIGTTKFRLSAISLIIAAIPDIAPLSFSSLETMLCQLFENTVKACPIVIGILAACSPNFSDAPDMALKITSAVNCPSLPSFLISARDLPMYSAIVSSRIGAASAMDLNSSPCNTPLPKACDNCISAAACCCACTPPIAIALLVASVKVKISCCV